MRSRGLHLPLFDAVVGTEIGARARLSRSATSERIGTGAICIEKEGAELQGQRISNSHSGGAAGGSIRDRHQQTLVNWLNPPDQCVLETTIGFEQVAIEVTAAVALAEPDEYLAQVYRFGLLEDFDHMYRYSALMDRMVVLGIWRLWVAGKRPDVPWSTRTLVGSLLLGWGIFNLVEGLIDHQLLGIHHVHPGQGQLAWDLGFLALGLLQVGAGWAAIAAGRADTTPPGGQVSGRSIEVPYE